MKRLFDILAWAVVVSWFMLIFIVGFWKLYPYRVFEVKSVEILTPTVKAGQNVVYRTSACKYMDVPGRISKVLVNDVFIPYSTYTAQTFTGCTSREVSSIIPEFADEGLYHIHITAEYPVNPVRTITVNYDTPLFKVVK